MSPTNRLPRCCSFHFGPISRRPQSRASHISCGDTRLIVERLLPADGKAGQRGCHPSPDLRSRHRLRYRRRSRCELSCEARNRRPSPLPGPAETTEKRLAKHVAGPCRMAGLLSRLVGFDSRLVKSSCGANPMVPSFHRHWRVMPDNPPPWPWCGPRAKRFLRLIGR